MAEALEGIPDEWAEAGQAYRLIVLYNATKQLQDVLDSLGDDSVSDTPWKEYAALVLNSATVSGEQDGGS